VAFSQPAQPAEPVDPVPAEPVEPVEPAEPVDPAPVDPAPVDPAPVARSPEVLALERRIAELERGQRRWQRRWERKHRPKAPPDDAATVTAGPGKGFTVATADGRFSATLKARVQIRDAIVHEGEATSNELAVRAARLGVNGNFLDPALRFNLLLAFGAGDFDKDSSSPVFDAYVEYVGLRDANVRVGQFFVPFDRFRTNRDPSLQLIDRPLVVRELTLDRDVGAMLSSTDLFGSKVLGYYLFVGGGEGRNRVGGVESGPLAVARLVVRPFGMFDEDVEGDLARDPRPRLALGVAGAYNHATTRQSGPSGPTLARGTMSYFHGAVDGHLKIAGLSLLAEGVFRRRRGDPYLEGDVDGEVVREWTRSGYGYVVQLGQMVHDLVEVAARWEDLYAWPETDPALEAQVDERGRQVGAGLNVYLNGHAFKLQADYFYNFGRDVDDGRHAVVLAVDASL
jgi:hypothetical protein